MPDAIVRIRRVGRETYFVPTDAQGTFSHEAESDHWEVSVVSTDGFSGSDSETVFVSPDQTITFEPFVVQRLVYDVEIRGTGPAVPYLTEVGAYATVRWTNVDAEPHSIQFSPSPGNSGLPMGPPLATGEQFEWHFDSQEAVSSTCYRCGLHPNEIEGIVLVDWNPS